MKPSQQPFWPEWNERHFARGPEDEPDERVNGDPDGGVNEDHDRDDTAQPTEIPDGG